MSPYFNVFCFEWGLEHTKYLNFIFYRIGSELWKNLRKKLKLNGKGYYYHFILFLFQITLKSIQSSGIPLLRLIPQMLNPLLLFALHINLTTNIE